MEKKNRILIVDDILKNIQLLGTVLRDAGYETAFATNGKDALDVLSKNQFDLILLDVMMPILNGYDTCIQIRNTLHLTEIPIIFLTAKDDQESIVQGLEAGGQDYVIKPFNEKELLARIETHLELAHKRRELAQMNELLEEKVNERTAQLQQANSKLEAFNQRILNLEKAKSNFLGLISHELRTPLNGIFGISELLRYDLKSDEHQEYLCHLEESAQRLLSFSDTALLITHLTANNYYTNFTKHPMVDLIEKAIEKNRTTNNLKQCNFSVDITPVELELNCDIDIVIAALERIINNAIRYNREKGRIDIKCENENGNIIINVSDQGEGFPQGMNLDEVELFQIENVRHHQEGFGLSLATVKLIMELHNGELSLGNQDGAGAFVHLVFPVRD